MRLGLIDEQGHCCYPRQIKGGATHQGALKKALAVGGDQNQICIIFFSQSMDGFANIPGAGNDSNFFIACLLYIIFITL